ncbi:MAG: deoxyhypusine synthase family protein [Candidatus Bathyarchaeota archaeon]|nr:MAG: deoxyhypusine synthase family protein [Candidatus Bathyarchaeota archaeon]
MKREDLFEDSVVHMKVRSKMTVNELIAEFGKSGSFGAGRVAEACDIYERMVRDEECTILLSLAGAVVPAGLRSILADLIRKRFVDVVVTTGANVIHDLLEAFGGHHYKGHWRTDDWLLYKYHTYRIYDIFVPEEDFIKEDSNLVKMFDQIAEEKKDYEFSSNELMTEIGKRIDDSNSIVRSAYDAKVPIFVPAIRDSEFSYIHLVHMQRRPPKPVLKVNAFKETLELVEILKKSSRIGMVVLGGGVPRNTIQHSAAISRKGIDYAILITMDRPETGGLSGSTLSEATSWGKIKPRASKATIVGDVMVVFPLMAASILERFGDKFARSREL